MNILLIGQCTLHWGRMEFGNIGNYYIMEPLVRELHRVFPDALIKTTFQMSDRFCQDEKIQVLPMEMYYGWREDDLDQALMELASAEIFAKTGYLPKRTPYLDEVMKSDLVIDFSGDIWGDNANFLGDHRFLVGLCKDRSAQLLGKPTVMLAGSPGPFADQETKEFAKEVYRNFALVTNREPISIQLLKQDGFQTDNTRSLACPAFLFEPLKGQALRDILEREGLSNQERPKVCYMICGWNFTSGPFDKPNRNDEEYVVFAQAVEYLSEELGVDVYLMSHSNGFPVPPQEFKLIHGRDYVIIKQLQKVVVDRGIAKHVYALDGVYDAWTTKGIIGTFDMVVSGRVHGAIAGLSQNVPTVLIDYGHAPKAHKIKGFAAVAGAEQYVADPSYAGDLITKIKSCWQNREQYRKHLEQRNKIVKEQVRANFDLLKEVMGQ